MIFRHVALFVLLCFVASCVSVAAGDAFESAESAGQADHSGGSRCPDPGSDGNACGPGCACVCCPGHWTGAAFALDELSLDIPPFGKLACSPPGHLYPKDILFRIFHPPRA